MKAIEAMLDKALRSNGKITFLVGAGLSAESGIPTFRGEEGYWKVGSVNYQPQEIGTYRMFKEQPEEVWKWFLFRKTVCRKALPNNGHYALLEIEQELGDRFALLSQNVDGLHTRAGSSEKRMCLVHGNLEYARCGDECTRTLYPFPELEDKTRTSELSADEINQLKCPKCGSWLRPHVLWFDEIYNEYYYKFETAQNVSYETELLFTIGTSGATTLPVRAVDNVMYMNKMLVDINIDENYFSALADSYVNGYSLRGKSGEVLPQIASYIKKMS